MSWLTRFHLFDKLQGILKLKRVPHFIILNKFIKRFLLSWFKILLKRLIQFTGKSIL